MKNRLVSVLFAVSVFVSAFLLFQIQPLISKAILPWFGGTPNVWTTCLLFFQTVLFGGYVYAHLLTSKLTPRWQATVHSVLLIAAVATISILPDATWKPTGDEAPVIRILGLLLVTVGLPYFVLSTTGPLLQSWFGRTFPGRSPYRLYALSNIGSLLALVSYPFLFEPVIGMSQQSSIWSIGFFGLALLCGLCGWVSVFFQTEAENATSAESSQPISQEMNVEANVEKTAGSWWQWFSLSMMASVMLLACTNQVCQDVAVVPFLWVIPLSLYLLSFILCFDGEQWYSRLGFGLGGAFSLALVTFLMTQPPSIGLVVEVLIYFSALFAVCMICHGELARLKPEPARLTSFYLIMAAGGASGGVFVGVIAPAFFPLLLEMHFALVLCSALAIGVYLNENGKRSEANQIPAWVHYGAYAAVIVTAISLQSQASGTIRNSTRIERNFYGVLRIEDQSPHDPEEHTLNLRHGRILHGVQYQSPEKMMIPTTYFGPDSGIGRTFSALNESRPSIKVGVVGLGIGTLSGYGRKSDHFRYYEINEAVVRIARDNFRFLSGSPSKTETIVGDARLVLEREDPQGYDLLVLDAFSGDSVPTHLLTKEAVKIYMSHLNERGVLAFHVSNLHLDLASVTTALADQVGMEFRLAKFYGDDATSQVSSLWMIASHDKDILDDPGLLELTITAPKDRVLWTDDFSNLYSVLK